MRRDPRPPLLVALALGAVWNAAQAAETAAAPVTPASLHEAITGGKAHLDFRIRLENVEQEPFADEANAVTLRSRLNYQTIDWNGLVVFAEADSVAVLGDGNAYNSTTNGVAARPLVADPEGTEVNQAYLQFTAGGFTGVLGRQRIALDNQRFVGNVGWRQNEQTYDAVTLRTTLLSKTQLQYSFIANVNRVTGPETGTQPANYHGASHVLHGRVALGDLGVLSAFAVVLDFDNAAAASNSTFGMRWSGSRAMSGGLKLGWAASLARQSNHGHNPEAYSSDYRLVEASLGGRRVGFTAGHEMLGGDARPNRAFQTPLATLHAFQGWADKFLTTPAGGIEDLYLGGNTSLGPVALLLVWHDFRAEAADQDYGTEWDASAAYRFGAKSNHEVLVKFADYHAEDFGTHTRKLWVQLSATF